MNKINCFLLILISPLFSFTSFANDLPLWMETSRIQPVINSFYPVNRLPITSGKMYRGNENTDEVFSKSFLTLRSMGITAATELTKDNWRPPSWPSEVPSRSPNQPEIPDIGTSLLNKSADVVLSLSQNAQANGMHLGGYYWNTGEGRPKGVDTRSPSSKFLYKPDSYQWSPPDSWLCKTLKDKLAAVTLPNGTIRGYYLDFTSPAYRKFTLQRFRELSHRRVDNIFFDERHQPNHEDDGCFGGATEAAYVKRFGKSELPRKKNFNDRKYRQYITFQGQKLAETFRYWKTELEKEFGDDRPMFTINGLYLSGFTFPHMSLDLADVADSVKVEFRNGVRAFISEGFKAPDIDPVFRHPVKIPIPDNDIRTALALVIARDGANGRPFTSWAVEDDFSSQEKATVFHATVLAYGGIAAPNLNFKNMQGIVLNQKGKAQFKRNFQSAINLVKKIEPNLAFSRPYKFAAIHLSEAQRKNKLTAASIWRDIMWPIHSAFMFFVREGLPAGIITDKHIIEGKLNEYKLVYFPVSNINDLSPFLRNAVKNFQQHGGLVIWKDKQYKVGQPSIKLQAFSDLIKSGAPIRVDYGDNIPSNINPHASFFTKNNGQTEIVAVLNDFTHILHRQAKSKNKVKPRKITGAHLILDYKPLSVREVISNAPLNVQQLNTGQYLVNIPRFQTISLISIQKFANGPQPGLDINPKFASKNSIVTAEIYLNESSCSQLYLLDWGDGSSQKIEASSNCPKSLRLNHRYKKSGNYSISLTYRRQNKLFNLSQNVDIKNIGCNIQSNKKNVKNGQAITLKWRSNGANTAILSHGAGPVPLSGQRRIVAPLKSPKIEYQLTIYNKDMRHLSSCSTSVNYIN